MKKELLKHFTMLKKRINVFEKYILKSIKVNAIYSTVCTSNRVCIEIEFLKNFILKLLFTDSLIKKHCFLRSCLSILIGCEVIYLYIFTLFYFKVVTQCFYCSR